MKHQGSALLAAHEEQTAVALQPFLGNQEPFAGWEHIVLLTAKDGAAKVGKGNAQTALVEHDGHVGLQPVAVPAFTLFHAQRHDVEALRRECLSVAAEPVDELL